MLLVDIPRPAHNINSQGREVWISNGQQNLKGMI